MLPAIHAKKTLAATLAATTGIIIFALAPHAGAATPSNHVLHDAHLVHCGNDSTDSSCAGVNTAAAAQAAKIVNAVQKYVGYKLNVAQEATAVDTEAAINATSNPAQQKALATAGIAKIKAEATSTN